VGTGKDEPNRLGRHDRASVPTYAFWRAAMWNLVIVSIASVTRCAFFGTLPRPSTRPPQRQHSDYTAAGLPVPTSQHPGEGWARPGELL